MTASGKPWSAILAETGLCLDRFPGGLKLQWGNDLGIKIRDRLSDGHPLLPVERMRLPLPKDGPGAQDLLDVFGAPNQILSEGSAFFLFEFADDSFRPEADAR